MVVSFVGITLLLPSSYLATDLTADGDNTETVYNVECLDDGATFAG